MKCKKRRKILVSRFTFLCKRKHSVEEKEREKEEEEERIDEKSSRIWEERKIGGREKVKSNADKKEEKELEKDWRKEGDMVKMRERKGGIRNSLLVLGERKKRGKD